MPFCKNCGSSIEDGAKFCENCGTPIEAPVAQPAEQPVAQPAAQPAPQPVQAQPVQSQSTTQYQSSQVPEGTNGFCIAGFICALATVLMGVGLVPALILSIVGLVQVKKSGQKGKGFAIAGIIIPIAVMVIAIICVILYFVFIIAGAAIASNY
ncbi:MAG: zinc ribbon domain-containing protein [Saccharofermentans sp.]|nr:zinc ribbon domain-containing protein [Saccharofermentans sp.]